MTARKIRDRGNGYPEADTGPLTDAERAAMERRRVLEARDAGKRKKGPPNMHRGAAPDSYRAVGMDDVEAG